MRQLRMNPEILLDRMFRIIEEECRAQGYSLHSFRWWGRKLDCTRLQAKEALEHLYQTKRVWRSTHYDENGVRRVKVSLYRRKNDGTESTIHKQ